jgi:dynein light chain LC8-type
MAAEDEASGESSWRRLNGAKVQWPADMPDDMLRMAIDLCKSKLASKDWQNDGDKAVSEIKAAFDETFGPNWHVVVGKHFGALATHESRRFCFFYLDDLAVMIYKSA